MEIQKIFSELGGEEKLYSISLDETEMILFSEFQKEFNSKTQKALRHKVEMQQGKEIIERNSNGFVPEDKRFYKKVARDSNKAGIIRERLELDPAGKQLTKSEILHSSINSKGMRNGSLASGDRLVNGDTSERINRGRGIKKNLMKGETYDHTKTGAESIAKNKDIMKTFKTEDQLKTIKNNLQAKENKKFYDKLEKETKQRIENNLKKTKNIKKIAGKTALGVAGVTGAAVIGKKLYDKKKKKQ